MKVLLIVILLLQQLSGVVLLNMLSPLSPLLKFLAQEPDVENVKLQQQQQKLLILHKHNQHQENRSEGEQMIRT